MAKTVKGRGRGKAPSLSIVKVTLYEVVLKSPHKGFNGIVLTRAYTRDAASDFVARLKGTRKKSQIRRAIRWAARGR